MRTIWLIRHCEPKGAGNGICLGRRGGDPRLCAAGIKQACELASRFERIGVDRVYTSPLLRARQTAKSLGAALVLDGLTEQGMGEWDGLSWDEIRASYPELYEMRAADKSLLPPGAESCEAAANRYVEALESTEGDCLAIGHRGSIGSFLCRTLGHPYSDAWAFQIPYACVMRLNVRDDRFEPYPTPDQAASLYRECGTPEQVVRHCRAVADLSFEIACDLASRGVPLSPDLTRAAALVHDVCRAEREHPARGAEVLERAGYPIVAQIVRKHHSADQRIDVPDEASVVFLADKLVVGTRRVSLEERFERSRAKCATEEARAKHAVLLETSRAIRSAVERIGSARPSR